MQWRALLISVLVLLPLALFAAVGAWSMYESGRLGWWWLVLPAAWGAAWIVARRWRKRLVPLPESSLDPQRHFTERDREAQKLVRVRAEAVGELSREKLTDLRFYFETAQELALDVARIYHPKTHDPLAALTVPEILAAGQLALEDLAELYDRYVPGGHFLTIRQFRAISKWPGHFRRLRNLWRWGSTLAYALSNPLVAAGRYASTTAVESPIAQTMLADVVAWFYKEFVQKVGYYAIEVNSGRLRGGAKRFREAMRRIKESAGAGPAGGVSLRVADNDQFASHPQAHATGSPAAIRELTVCVVGQVQAGKSSVVSALLGGHKAELDLLPRTSGVMRHRAELPESSGRLVLLDTLGYGDEIEARRLGETRRALEQADLVLLVLHAASPDREPDRAFLAEAAGWFASRPQLKAPPVLGVLTHIDVLEPQDEWSPPLDFARGDSAGEQSIREAVAESVEQLAGAVVDVIPVCSDVANSRVRGVRERLVPAMIAALDEARACSVLRDLHAEIDAGKVRRLFHQFRNLGRALRGGGT